MTDEMKQLASSCDADILLVEAMVVEEDHYYLMKNHIGYTAEQLRLMARWAAQCAA